MNPELEPYLSADARASWERCLLVWRKRGRVEDRARNKRMPKYSPDLGKRLGWTFAETFPEEFGFVVSRLKSDDPVERLCAFEVLEYMFNLLDSRKAGFGQAIPPALLVVKETLPDQALTEIRSDNDFNDFKGQTIGEFFTYLDAKP